MQNAGSLIAIALLWTGWCVCHSLLISRSVTALMRHKLGRRYAWYRLAYNLFSAASLVPVVFYHYTLSQRELFSWQGSWMLLQGALLLYALVMFFQGLRVYDMPYFLGIRQIKAYQKKEEEENLPFRTDCRTIVRHPWYSAGIALAWAAGDISDVTLVAKLIISVYFVVGAILEEKKLLAEIGEPYREFCRDIPMLIPFVRG